jgi:hypothetical protein
VGIECDALEREAKRIYRRAGIEWGRGTPPARLARALLGAGAITVVPEHALPTGGALACRCVLANLRAMRYCADAGALHGGARTVALGSRFKSYRR